MLIENLPQQTTFDVNGKRYVYMHYFPVEGDETRGLYNVAKFMCEGQIVHMDTSFADKLFKLESELRHYCSMAFSELPVDLRNFVARSWHLIDLDNSAMTNVVENIGAEQPNVSDPSSLTMTGSDFSEQIQTPVENEYFGIPLDDGLAPPPDVTEVDMTHVSRRFEELSKAKSNARSLLTCIINSAFKYGMTLDTKGRNALCDEGLAEIEILLHKYMQEAYGRAQEMREAENILGLALGYPRYCDDKKNFPDATEADGVCIGEHVLSTLALEAGKKLVDYGKIYESLLNLPKIGFSATKTGRL